MSLEYLGIKYFRTFGLNGKMAEFEFAPITILTGPNNSGKSSLLKLLTLLKSNFVHSDLPDIQFIDEEQDLGEVSNITTDNNKIHIKLKVSNPLALNINGFEIDDYYHFYLLFNYEVNNEKINLSEFILKAEVYNNPEKEYKLFKLNLNQDRFDNNILNNVRFGTVNFNRENILKVFFERLKVGSKVLSQDHLNKLGKFLIPANSLNIENQSVKDSFSLFNYLKKWNQDNVESIIEEENNTKFMDLKSFILKVNNVFFDWISSINSDSCMKIIDNDFRTLSNIPAYRGLTRRININSKNANYIEKIYNEYLNIQDYIDKKEYYDEERVRELKEEQKTITMDIEKSESDYLDQNTTSNIMKKFKELLYKKFDIDKIEYPIILKEHFMEILNMFNISENIKINNFLGNNIEISLKIKNDPIRNVVDHGFGYSQLLPLLLSIFNSSFNYFTEKFKKQFSPTLMSEKDLDNSLIQSIDLPFLPTIIIEEPESHLHPNMQSKIADLLVKSNSVLGTRYIVETHSEYLIRKLQYLVAKGTLNKKDIVIYYFDQDPTKEEYIKKIQIDDYGMLSEEFGSGFVDEASLLITELWDAKRKN